MQVFVLTFVFTSNPGNERRRQNYEISYLKGSLNKSLKTHFNKNRRKEKNYEKYHPFLLPFEISKFL